MTSTRRRINCLTQPIRYVGDDGPGDLLVTIAQWLPAALAGSGEALGQALEACRSYLLLIARKELEPALQAKGDAADLVQQTFLEAQRDLARFHGTTADALLAWLRRLLLNNVANFRRDYHRGKRCVSRELSLRISDRPADSDAEPISGIDSPSVILMLTEQAQALSRAVERLPDDYRLVVHLRYREGQSFEAIAEAMQRSPNAVRKLCARAIESLQKNLTPP